MVIENKQAGRRHGGSQFVLGLPIGFFSSFARWRYGLHDALQTKCTQIVYCVFLQLKVKGALAAEIGNMGSWKSRSQRPSRRRPDMRAGGSTQTDESGGKWIRFWKIGCETKSKGADALTE